MIFYRTRWMLHFGLVAGVVVEGCSGGDPTVSDDVALQGTWQVILVEDSGKQVPQAQLQDSRVIITADKLTMIQGSKNEAVYTYKIDATKNPRWIDQVGENRTFLGIYELIGDDLKICTNSGRGEARANAFVSENSNRVASTDEKSGNNMLMVLKREAKAPK